MGVFMPELMNSGSMGSGDDSSFWGSIGEWFSDKGNQDKVIAGTGAVAKMLDDRKKAEAEQILAMNKAKWSGFRGGDMTSPIAPQSSIASLAGGAAQNMKIADELDILLNPQKREQQKKEEQDMKKLILMSNLYKANNTPVGIE